MSELSDFFNIIELELMLKNRKRSAKRSAQMRDELFQHEQATGETLLDLIRRRSRESKSTDILDMIRRRGNESKDQE